MFDVDLNGNIIYSGGVDSGSDDLFSAPTPVPTVSPENQMPVPATVSSGDVPSLLPSLIGEDLTLTVGNVYIYPETADGLPEDRSVGAANVLGLPNSTSLQYLEDVVRGYPSHYKYLAFKTDANYAQSMVLYIAPKAEKNSAQNRIDFQDVDCVQVYYGYSGGSYYYNYTYNHYNSYSVPYNTNVFLYTNVVDGYAVFDRPASFPVAGCLFAAFALAVLLIIFKGGGKK